MSPGITLLAGSEVNILPDGSLDYPDDLLAELDWVVASVHTSFRMPKAEMTARIVRAIEHPYVDCIGHLSGRKIDAAPALRVRLRRDRSRPRCGPARCSRSTPTPIAATSTSCTRATRPAAGVPLVINCDAHRTGGFEVARYGVATARRAWLTPSQIANTSGWKELAAQRSRQQALEPNWILANQARPPSVPISATQKFRRIPRMCTE